MNMPSRAYVTATFTSGWHRRGLPDNRTSGRRRGRSDDRRSGHDTPDANLYANTIQVLS